MGMGPAGNMWEWIQQGTHGNGPSKEHVGMGTHGYGPSREHVGMGPAGNTWKWAQQGTRGYGPSREHVGMGPAGNTWEWAQQGRHGNGPSREDMGGASNEGREPKEKRTMLVYNCNRVQHTILYILQTVPLPSSLGAAVGCVHDMYAKHVTQKIVARCVT